MVVRTDRVRKLAVILVSDFDGTTKLKHAGPENVHAISVLISSHPMSSVLLFFWLLVSKKIQMSTFVPWPNQQKAQHWWLQWLDLRFTKLKRLFFSTPLYQSKKRRLSELQGYFHHSSLILKLPASFVCISTNAMASYISELVPYNKWLFSIMVLKKSLIKV